jgi:hypothetical protein
MSYDKYYMVNVLNIRSHWLSRHATLNNWLARVSPRPVTGKATFSLQQVLW